MKPVLVCFLFAFLVTSCDRHENSTAPSGSAANHSHRNHRKEIRLPYAAPSATTQEAGHQAYLFDKIWASSREDIIQRMTLAGWNLVPDYKSSDPTIRFYSESPGPITGPPDGIRWERD